MSDESFLQRWARFKAEKRREERAVAPAEAPPQEALPAAAQQAPPPTEEAKPPELPPIETLTAESDYSLFMRAEVPEETRLAALRKLWTSDPVLAAQDPLDFQNLDFTFPKVPEVVKTAYVVGKGFLDAAEKLAEEGAGAKAESGTSEEAAAQDPERKPEG